MKGMVLSLKHAQWEHIICMAKWSVKLDMYENRL